jgi:hypothetical protein
MMGWIAWLVRQEQERQRRCWEESVTDSNPVRRARMAKESRSPMWLRLLMAAAQRAGVTQ